jgi:predicted deacylase
VRDIGDNEQTMPDSLKVSSEIIKLTGSEPGPVLAIFAGVHGNETVGVLTLQELIPKLKLTRGTLYLAYANPPAIEQNVRMIGKIDGDSRSV